MKNIGILILTGFCRSSAWPRRKRNAGLKPKRTHGMRRSPGSSAQIMFPPPRSTNSKCGKPRKPSDAPQIDKELGWAEELRH